MYRTILARLQQWVKSSKRKPLLLRGARQVGKTFIVDELAKMFKHFVAINFERDSEYKRCFQSLRPEEIINSIALIKGIPIIPGETLLFFDEIQACPAAIQALRYFKEDMPELHVIGAGSLLEFALQQENISIPVGRIEYLYMYPCSFDEFLLNSGNQALLEELANVNVEKSVSDAVHHHLLKLFREYMVVGGMPEAMQTYLESKDLYQVQRVQNSILQTYRDDFGKYANVAQQKYLQTVYDKVPGIIGNQVSYQKIDPEFRSRELKNAISLLEHAGVLKRIVATTASGLPLSATLQEKKFKLLFLDIGLVQCKSGLNSSALLNDDIMKLNAGALAEQAVGQELLVYQDAFSPGELYFWTRDKKNSHAEVDYMLNIEGKIVPLEVKSSEAGHLKSLHLFLTEQKRPLGIKVSTAPLSKKDSILNVPVYLISKIADLCK